MVDDLTHFDDRGRARMVDVGAKGVTEREARARGTVFMAPETLQLIKSGGIKKRGCSGCCSGGRNYGSKENL